MSYSQGKNPRSRANSTWCRVSTWKFTADESHKFGGTLKVKGFEVFLIHNSRNSKNLLVCFGIPCVVCFVYSSEFKKWRWVDTNSFLFMLVLIVCFHLFSYMATSKLKTSEGTSKNGLCFPSFLHLHHQSKKDQKDMTCGVFLKLKLPSLFACSGRTVISFMTCLFACLCVCLFF